MCSQSLIPFSTARAIENSRANGFPIQHVNGTKIYGPPSHWVGPPPSSSCELFIRYMPTNTDEHRLFKLCLLFGQIYQFRIPLNYPSGIRGYSYVRYTREKDAECALELLNHCFIGPQIKLNVVNSVEKCWLYVCNILKTHSDEEIERRLRTVFPNMQRVFSRLKHNQNHTKSVYVGFESHNDAMDGKNTCNGIYELLGDDVSVVWANVDREDSCLFNKRLLFQNVDQTLSRINIIELITKYVPRKTIGKIDTDDRNVVVSFTSRSAGVTVLQQMQGTFIEGTDTQFVIKWAKLSPEEHRNRLRKTDFDALLRIKCIANRWHIPVLIFGTCFEDDDVQYAAVFLRNADFRLRFVIVTLQCSELFDIHSRLCEVVVSVMDTCGEFPRHNYVFCAKKNTAQLAGIVKFSPHMEFIPSHGETEELFIDIKEVFDLSRSCVLLSDMSEDELLQTYNNGFMSNNYQVGLSFGDRVFGAIPPNYRRKPPLRYNLDDVRIVLALCYHPIGRNYTVGYHRPSNLSRLSFAVNSSYENAFFSLTLLPLSLVQKRNIFSESAVKRISSVLLSIGQSNT